MLPCPVTALDTLLMLSGYLSSAPPRVVPSSMHSASPGKKRHEVWQWFVDEGSRTGNRTAKHGKTKVYCAQCLDAHMDLLQETDEQSGIERTSEERYTECEKILIVLTYHTNYASSVYGAIRHPQ